MKMLIVLFGLMFSVVGFSADIFPRERIASTADSYEKYMRIADDHLNYGRTDEAIEFYKKAVGVVTKLNKLRGYMQIVENYYKMGLEWDSSLWHHKATIYLDTNPAFTNDEESYLFFLYYKVILSGNLSSEVLTSEEIAVFEGDDIYGQILEYDFKVYFLRKDYAAAFKMFQGSETSYFPMTHKIYYDLSNFLVNKGDIKNLICSPTLAGDPLYRDYDATYNFCYVLENYLATKKKDAAKMEVLKKMIEKDDIKLLFLYDAFNSNI